MLKPIFLVSFFGVFALMGQQANVKVELSQPGRPLDITHFSLGQGGLSDDPIWGSRIPEIRALHPRLIRLFIQEYFDVMPAVGQYNWTKLDKAVDMIREADSSPIMTIAIKPKALFPKIDDSITDPNDYAAWDKLIYAMVRHYKDRGLNGQYWEVANEPDIGEDGGCPYHFTPEGYTRYYKHTALAIKRADPNARVGGPALANPNSPILPALLRFCVETNVPLDFISWHIYNNDPLQIRATIDRKKEMLRKFATLHPETILDEWNMSLGNPVTDPRFQPCFVAETAWQMKEAGLDYSAYYHIRDYHVRPQLFGQFMSPKGTTAMAWWWNRKPQYDGLFDYQNHVRPAYFTFLLLARLTGQRLPLDSSSPAVHGLATWDASIAKYNVLLWNFSAKPAHVTFSLTGVPAGLTAHPEMLDALAPSDDENIRLRPLAPLKIASAEASVPLTLQPYQVIFWEIDKR
jgi:xylan 1,4-beta-xylosidase